MRVDDEAAFIQIVESRSAHLRRSAYSLSGDWHLADDLVQRALLKLFLAWPLRDPGGVDAWLTRTLTRAFIDETRRPRWRREHSSDALPDRAPLEDPAGDGGLHEQLSQIPPRMRACLVLRFVEDLSVEQTADVLNCSSGTVRSQTSRGLAALGTSIDNRRNMS